MVLGLLLGLSACGGRLGRQYEYEEELFLDLDGSATLIVNASVAALVALRGAPLDPDPRARLDRAAVGRLYQAPGVEVVRVSRPWRRHGRRFVQVRLRVADVRHLARAAPLGWSQYQWRRGQDEIVFKQTVGPARGLLVRSAGWSGEERVAFRLHIPSRIRFHTAPAGGVERGNILVWEQPLAERLRGVPLTIEVRMETQSILARTLLLFGGAFAAAVLTLGAFVWWAARRGGLSNQEGRP
jgi:hypothetical protein